MGTGDYGEECATCECLTCIKNDEAVCTNCNKCDGCDSYSKWMMECEKYEECNNPEEAIKTILG